MRDANMLITIFGWFCLVLPRSASFCLVLPRSASFCLVLICVAVAGFAIALAADCVRRSLERFEWAVDTKTRQSVGRSLSTMSWWFSESPDTSLAVRMIADHLATGAGIDANQIREQWRKGRASVQSTSTQEG